VRGKAGWRRRWDKKSPKNFTLRSVVTGVTTKDPLPQEWQRYPFWAAACCGNFVEKFVEKPLDHRQMARDRIGDKMKVIFLQDVPNVASAGDVKEVANGYARNYLFPKKLAALATPAELQKLESRRQADARRQAGLEQEAESLAEVLGNLTVALKVRAGAKDRIYGSVTTAAIAKEIKRLIGHEIDKHNIELEEPIRELGSHQVSIRLTRNVTANVNVLVEAKEEEEKEEKQKEETDKEPETEQTSTDSSAPANHEN